MELLEVSKPIVAPVDAISIAEDRILATDNIEQQPYVLRIDGIGKLSRGNISAWNGVAKSRKTYAISLAVGGLVTGNSVHYHFQPCGKGLAWADTEQSPYDAQRVVKRLRDLNKSEDGLYFYQMRKYGAKVRKQKVKAILEKHKDELEMIVIDGIRDLVVDFNDPVESSEIVTDLMAWSVDYDVHIAVVLHANKGDGFMRGHLGTELENKSEAVFKVEREDNLKDVSKVSEQFGRGKNVDDFYIKINDQGMPEVVEDIEIETGVKDDNDAPWMK